MLEEGIQTVMRTFKVVQVLFEEVRSFLANGANSIHRIGFSVRCSYYV